MGVAQTARPSPVTGAIVFEPPFHWCLGEVLSLMGVKAGPSRFEKAEVAQPGDGLAA
jgi:hypothetical protein